MCNTQPGNAKSAPALNIFLIIILISQAFPLMISRSQTTVTPLYRILPVNIMINKSVLPMLFYPPNISISEDLGCIWFRISIRDDMIDCWA